MFVLDFFMMLFVVIVVVMFGLWFVNGFMILEFVFMILLLVFEYFLLI